MNNLEINSNDNMAYVALYRHYIDILALTIVAFLCFSAISKFSIKYKSPLNIRSDSFVFLGSFTAHTSLGLSYLLIGYKGLVAVGMLVSVYLFLNLKNLTKLAIEVNRTVCLRKTLSITGVS